MGKQSKRRFRNICCWGDSKDGGNYEKQNKAKNKSKKAADVEVLRQEVDELGEMLESMIKSLDAAEENFKAMEGEIDKFFSESMVEKMSEKFRYRAPLMLVHSEVKPSHGVKTSFTTDDKVYGVHDRSDIFEISGKFGNTNGEGLGLARGKRQLKEKNFIDLCGLTKIIQPLPSMQAVLHHEILTTLNFPFRVTLRDLMLGNKFSENHAQFLCVNLLIALKHLHSLNMIHGQISPSRVIFTQFGYPCLTGVDTFQTYVDISRPKARIEYRSPEQVKGEPITEATDMFQMGILVYSMIYRKSPFKADTYYKTRANLLDDDFIPEFEHGTLTDGGRCFIKKLLKTNSNDRFKLETCRKPLDKAVKWFSLLSQHELLSQVYPSPFKGPLMREIVAD